MSILKWLIGLFKKRYDYVDREIVQLQFHEEHPDVAITIIATTLSAAFSCSVLTRHYDSKEVSIILMRTNPPFVKDGKQVVRLVIKLNTDALEELQGMTYGEIFELAKPE